MATPLIAWALPRLQQILPLDDESLKQVIAYAETLPKEAAAEHLKNLLGDDAKSLEFISSFNLRRGNVPASTTSLASNGGNAAASSSEAPARKPRQPKKKPNIHALPARRVEGSGNVTGAYQRPAEDSYMPAATSRQQSHKDQVADNLALRQRRPDATQMPLITDDASLTTKPITSKPPPSASGPLISDGLAPKKKNPSTQSSRNASPAPKTKVNISGGMAMHGASTALSDLDSAIRSLELQTNPTLSTSTPADNDKRKCNCMATRHPLLDMAPNCLECGKVICVKEGLGPCTFCGAALLSTDDVHKVLKVLKEERGDEKMKLNNASHRRADVAQGKPRAFTGRDFLAQASSSNRPSPLSSTAPSPMTSDDDEATNKAKAHRDRLLNFQANNARRTQIHDEAADFDVPTSGTNMWASPVERAKQLKRQQKVMREMEWNAKPEWEKRQVVASIDLVGGRVVKRMKEVERPDFEVEGEGEDDGEGYKQMVPEGGDGNSGGAFSNNPLAAGLIRPMAREGGGDGKGRKEREERSTTWRRVQMDEDDNEQWILDGGVYGGNTSMESTAGDEPA
ncbi:unnamed protein product [Zymoseptoria tritici ST99CH_1A5]|uniref:TRIP4/RQT4 C2HC5-type zinc finger domain-containing protein n=2 Tax=Zymoseptoria tritici TaxID=1047171 RepID=A0A1X7RT87_ZYMT9|nr:unnamed protein product [Zymoseptoria tritici ST99CH_3D7]SMR52119.1 unnamed protein product [Zymoseptoria tritici ST99CH_3D1]SMY23849.1 unnamed protein product [Zymoseptoria tritici ST99CH_1A5]